MTESTGLGRGYSYKLDCMQTLPATNCLLTKRTNSSCHNSLFALSGGVFALP